MSLSQLKNPISFEIQSYEYPKYSYSQDPVKYRITSRNLVPTFSIKNWNSLYQNEQIGLVII